MRHWRLLGEGRGQEQRDERHESIIRRQGILPSRARLVGTRANVVAEEARAVVDVRAPTGADAARIDAAIRAVTPVDGRTAIHVTGGFGRPPLERTSRVERLYGQAREVAEALGVRLDEGTTGGGSDGNFTAALGVSTLDGLGAIGDGAHALHEHVEIDALPDRAAIVAGLIERLQ